ncbi:hypothetical protein [Streptomyces sp. NPDC004783]|uniref:hypothetical protein n=1 Tax=Streptomyces sp. NPDC004783 TaxID=3154459 RepID=UPI0033B39759
MSGSREPQPQPRQDATQVLPTAGFPSGGDAPVTGPEAGRPSGPAGPDWFGEFPGAAATSGAPGAYGPDAARPDVPRSDAGAETAVLPSLGGPGRGDVFGAPSAPGGTNPRRAPRPDASRPGVPLGGRPQPHAHRPDAPLPGGSLGGWPQPDAPRPGGPQPHGPRTGGPRPGGPRPGHASGLGTDRTDVLPSAAPTRAFPAPGPGNAAPRDPWHETPGVLDADAPAPVTGGVDHTHDPHEVTVQLDAVQLGDGVLRRVGGSGGKHAAADVSDGPVFVDESGRRSRRFRRIGIALGVACSVYAVVIVSTLLSGNSDAPWIPVPDQEQGQPAGQVEPSPLIPQSPHPSASGGTPRTDPSTGADMTQAPGAGAGGPGTSATAEQPGGSAGPGPSATTRKPAGGAAGPDPTGTSQQPPSASKAPTTPTGGDPAAGPSQPAGGTPTGTGPGGGTTPDGAGAPAPMSAGSTPVPAGADEPGATTTHPYLSPEYSL